MRGRAIRLGCAMSVAIGLLAGVPSVMASPMGIDHSAVSVTVSNPDPAMGSVRVRLSGPKGARLRFSIPSKTSKAVITSRSASSRGSSTMAFTYTPTAAARHQAARPIATAADKSDRVAVAITDRDGASMALPVTIRVSPQNAAPRAHAVTSPPAQGSVVVAADGAFTCTPTASVTRSRSNAVGGTDSFTVTVSDGYGGTVSIPITCPAHG